jgi:branched-chain amino acid transport system substrate-binding protein
MVLAAALGASGCGGEREPVRIGVVLPADFAAPALLAAAEINAAGGVRGRRLEIVRDTVPSGTPDQEPMDIVRARSVLRRAVVAVLGHEGSGSSLSAAPVYNTAGVVELVPTGTSHLLAHAGRWTLALAPNDSAEGRFIATFVRGRLHATAVLLIHSNDRYGIGLRDGVRSALAAAGARVVAEVRYDGRADLAVLVAAALQRGAPDAVVIAGYAREAALIAREIRSLGVRAPIVAGDGAHALPVLVVTSPGATEGIYVVTFWLPGSGDSATSHFESAIRSHLGREPAARDAMAYDGMRLLAAAIEAVGPRPGRVLAYLRSLGVGHPRYRGLTGEIGFGAGAGAPRFVMGQVRGEVVVPVEGGGP